MATYKAIFHVDESSLAKWKLVLVNIENLMAEFGEDIEIELLANAEGISLLYKTPNHFKETITRLSARGVQFALCANSLKQQNLTKEFFLDMATVVPSGVGELVIKQSAGWAYIKP